MARVLTSECRHGTMSYYDDDTFVGAALETYGEYSELEAEVFRRVLRPGDWALDIGAHIGAFTVIMAKLVGPTGRVMAFEPGEKNCALLRRNVEQNGLSGWTSVHQIAASSQTGRIPIRVDVATDNYPKVDRGGGVTAQCIKIDDYNLEKLAFAKIDVDGHEVQCLKGMAETIERCRPILYVENCENDQRGAVIAEIVDHKYRPFWFTPTQYHCDNYKKVERNMFGLLTSPMMICVPDEKGIVVTGLDEVGDFRQDDDMFEREIRRFERYVKQDPKDLQSKLLIAHYHNLMQRGDKFDEIVNEIFAKEPDHLHASMIRGMVDLQRGNYKRGWKGYELRYSQRNLKTFGADRAFTAPKWDGQPTDKPVLISAEQGFGDQIMFARFVEHARKRAPCIYLEVHSGLYELFAISKVVHPNHLFRLGRTLPAYAYQCASPSLPAVLGDEGHMIRMEEPYLFPDPQVAKSWSDRRGPKIGICTRGSHRSERWYTRDLPDHLAADICRKYQPVLDLGFVPQFDGFADTAAAISTLELVITVDTSIAHLAGAMGAEVWLLLSTDPDWRWGLQGTTTPWYPTMRIFRQPKFRDWKSVMEEVEAALEERQEMAQAAE